MKLTKIHDDVNEKLCFLLEIGRCEYESAKFDIFDNRLMDECESFTKISDKLLWLETAARKIEEKQ